jgi:hypothetical protein
VNVKLAAGTVALVGLITLACEGGKTPGGEQAHDAAGACQTHPLDVDPVKYAPGGWTYVYTARILDADCNVLETSEGDVIYVDLMGHRQTDADARRNVNKTTIAFWDVHRTFNSPYQTQPVTIPRVLHAIVSFANVHMDADVMDDIGAEFLECVLYRDGRPVANDVRAVGREIKPIRPGTDTSVECFLHGESD